MLIVMMFPTSTPIEKLMVIRIPFAATARVAGEEKERKKVHDELFVTSYNPELSTIYLELPPSS